MILRGPLWMQEVTRPDTLDMPQPPAVKIKLAIFVNIQYLIYVIYSPTWMIQDLIKIRKVKEPWRVLHHCCFGLNIVHLIPGSHLTLVSSSTNHIIYNAKSNLLR